MKVFVLLAIALPALLSCSQPAKPAQPVAASVTAIKYFVAHQGGYVGEATVTIDAAQKVTAASLAEWQGPGGWAEFNSADKKALADGAVVRVPDPLANPTHANPQIKGYMFYIYNEMPNKAYIWSQYTPGEKGFAKPARQFERDFEGLMSNPIRAAAYVRAAKEDTLVNVTIDGLNVKVGKKASETIHYGHMNKADARSTYMPLDAASIGYRYNTKAMMDFFKANPTANFTAVSMKQAKVTLKEDKSLDATANVADYKAANDLVWTVADAVTGATFTDFPHYSLELQAAYKMAIAEQKVSFTR